MAKNIIQLNNSKYTPDVKMNLQEAIDEIISFSVPPITSFTNLDDMDQAKLALAYFEETNREELAEALAMDNKNSRVLSKIIGFLNEDTVSNRHDLCDAIKEQFISYFKETIADRFNEAIDQRQHNKLAEDGMKSRIDHINGETYYSRF